MGAVMIARKAIKGFSDRFMAMSLRAGSDNYLKS
jgi:hypothetical protein